VGHICRKGGDGENLEQAATFIEKFAAERSEEDMRRELEQMAREKLGAMGRLALCDLSLLNKTSDVLMAAVHVQVLGNQEDLNLCMTPVGTAHDDDDDDDDDKEDDMKPSSQWDMAKQWPEIFPDGWLVSKPRSYSIRYKLSVPGDLAREAKVAGKTMVIKGVAMSSNILLVSAMLEASGIDGNPISASLTVGDYVASTGGKSAVEAALQDSRTGLCGLLPTASALQLGEVVRNQILRPLLAQILPPVDTSATGSSRDTDSQDRDGSTRSWRRESNGSRGSGLEVPSRLSDPRRSLRVPRMGGPGGFGDDLLPGGGFGQGGMLFGPGNAAFDGRFGPGGGRGLGGHGFDDDDDDGFMGSVPPGARFDPYGPPGVGGMGGQPGPRNFRGSRNMGRGGAGPGRNFSGEPDPDHLRPPFGSDDMFS